MRILIALFLVALTLQAKDNFIYDYQEAAAKNDKRMTLLERESAELKSLAAARDEEMAKLRRSVKQIQGALWKIRNEQKSGGTMAAPTADDEKIREVVAMIAALEKKMERRGLGGRDRMRLEILDKKISALESRLNERTMPEMSAPIALPKWLSGVKHQYVEMFLVGVATLFLLMFILLGIAMGRSRDAQKRIHRLAELCQFNHKATEGKK